MIHTIPAIEGEVLEQKTALKTLQNQTYTRNKIILLDMLLRMNNGNDLHCFHICKDDNYRNQIIRHLSILNFSYHTQLTVNINPYNQLGF